MASAAFGHGLNQTELQPIIVKKVTAQHRPVHHGGQWKVAYADFVTAMMAFFMLLWLISTTDEDKRRGIADYFSPTLIEMKQNSAGSKGLLGGESLSEQRLLLRATTGGGAAIALPSRINGSPRKSETETKNDDRRRFEQLKKRLEERMDRTAAMRGLKTHVRFTETPEGLRIDLVDEADFSMFKIGTDRLVPRAMNLVREVSAAIANMPNAVIVRGHTDALPYADGQVMNNWMLSTARAEATRMALHQAGLGGDRFERIEGVADTQPFNPADRYDPRNRRMSITLAWSGGEPGPSGLNKSAPRQ